MLVNQIRLDEPFELLDKNGEFLELGTLVLKEHRELLTGKLIHYRLIIDLLAHDNIFLPDELSSQNVQEENNET